MLLLRFPVLLLLPVAVAAAEPPLPWLDSTGVAGALLVTTDEPSESIAAKFRDFAGDVEPRTVVLKLHDSTSDVSLSLAGNAIFHRGPFDDDARRLLITAVTEHPDRVAFCLQKHAALAIRGRHLEVLGDGAVTVIVAAAPGRPLRQFEIHPSVQHDWTMLRRAALERAHGPFPPLPAPPPVVEHGALVIVGGGTLTREITDKFFDLAGGSASPIVVLPIAAGDSLSGDEAGDTRVLTRAGATNVKSLRARTRAEVESPEFAAALNNAKGLWFSGGRQWRFVDAYLGTKAEALFRDVLRRGGVIGGSSAGASIQSQYMPRGSPLGNLDVMAEGYERGLGFLPGAAVDQHFTQRKRHTDMTALIRRHPQLLGIGIDEATALVVQGSTAQTIGRGHVYFYDYRPGPPADSTDYILSGAGQKYDLVKRRLLEND